MTQEVWDQLEEFSLVEATFRPQRTDNLRPEAHAALGMRTLWQALWKQGEGDPYPGQWALCPVDGNPFWNWVPQEDLTDPARVEVDEEGPERGDPAS